MKKIRFISVIGLISIITIGIITALSSNGEPEATANFKECQVYPENRCPTDDVRAHWSTSPPNPVEISYEGHSEELEAQGDWLLRAEDVNELPNTITFTMRVKVSNGQRDTFTVHTVMGIENHIRAGLRLYLDDYRFKIDMNKEVWSENLVVRKIILISDKKYQWLCNGDDYYYQWQYDKGRQINGFLTKENNYTKLFSPYPKLVGDWYFTLENVPQYCPNFKEGLPELSLKVSFEIMCE